jgi:hypothetical protein
LKKIEDHFGMTSKDTTGSHAALLVGLVEKVIWWFDSRMLIDRGYRVLVRTSTGPRNDDLRTERERCSGAHAQ